MVIHDEDKDLFLKTLNKSGFLLEEQVWKILNSFGSQRMERSKVINNGNKRIEIDFVFERKEHVLIGECKKTEYSWVFSRNLERSEALNLINDSSRGMMVKTRRTSDFKIVWTDVALKFNGENRIIKMRGGHPQVSTQEIHSHIKQVLRETEAYLLENRCIDKIIMPMIVTNAKLYTLDYTESNIDNNGNLECYESAEEVDGVVYNFPEVLKWDKGQQQIVANKGEPSEHHIKSVFIVNINHFKAYINKMLDQGI